MLQPLTHEELPEGLDPTGEGLLNRRTPPYKVWVPERMAIVLGNSQKPELELNIPTVLADFIPVYRRKGGGGAVVLGPTCICLGIRFRKLPGGKIEEYFKMGSGIVQKVAHTFLGIDLEPRGISDLGHEDKKILGCSLYIPKDFVLYLGSVLHGDGSAEAERYLAHPTREPEYRMGRGHGEFMTSLSAIAGNILQPSRLLSLMRDEILGQHTQKLDWPASNT